MNAQFLIYLFVNSLLIIGINVTSREGMVFEKLGAWIEKMAGEFWSKPLISCWPCMASIHGTYFYFAFVGSDIGVWLVYVFALAGWNYIMSSLNEWFKNI